MTGTPAPEVRVIDLRVYAAANRSPARDDAFAAPARLPLTAAALCALNALLAWPVLLPRLGAIGMWDESVYINAGRELAGGTLPTFSANPLVAALYAAIYAVVRESPFWLVHAATAGRIALFLLLWTAAYQVAMQLRPLLPPVLLLGLLAVSPIAGALVHNGSDALFAALASFALAQLLAFHRTRELAPLARASALVGLAALSRNEGLLLFAILVAVAAALSRADGRWRRALVAAVAPAAAVVGGYLLLFTLVTGRVDLGTAGRAYFAFEQGQGMAYAHRYPDGADYYAEGQLDARRLYGTEEENHGSVLAAIARNPAAYAERLALVTAKVPGLVMYIYGGVIALVLLVLAARGVVALWQRGERSLLAVLAAWPAYLLLQILLVYRPQHFLLPFAVLLALAAFGLGAVGLEPGRDRERVVWWIALTGAAVAGVVLGKPALVRFGALLLLGLVLLRALVALRRARPAWRWLSAAGVAAAVAVGLALQGTVPRIERRALGTADDERAVLALRAALPARAPVGAYSPGYVWTAGMTHVPMHLELRGLRTADDLAGWIRRERVAAVYVNEHLRRREPGVWALLEAQVGRSLDVAYRGPDGDGVEVLVVRGGAAAPVAGARDGAR